MSRASSSSSLSSLELPDLLVSISDCAKDLMDYSKQQFMRLKGLEILEASYKNTETSFKKLQGAYGTSSDNPNEKKPTISSQERESLRCALEKLEKDRAAFQSEKQTMLRKIEKEQRQLAMEKTKLEEETRKYKEEAETLQIQIDNFYSQTRNCTGARISGLSSRSSVPSEGSVSATESTGDSDSARTLLDRAATSPPHSNSTANLLQKTISQVSRLGVTAVHARRCNTVWNA
ncbi:unnamed protein product [Dibothriocephalus latus]|uniref:Uncharacterized protein n=1 Tax=Dibothriocephalus latus TaxID=60516 RepID=A0A3P7NNJ5_DIBLA|nr:unnamed protein product [Dibothriocephalus latus]